MIADRRKKFMQQVTVRGVNFDYPEPGSESAPCSGFEAIYDAVNAFLIQCNWQRITFIKTNRTRCYGKPSRLVRSQLRPAFPCAFATAFASGVRELNAGDCALALHESSDPRQRFNLFVFPDADIARGNPALARHRRCLDKNECGTADGATAEMHKMPIMSKPILSGILAHRRHDDPVPESHPANRERAQEIYFRNFAVVIGAGPAAMDNWIQSLNDVVLLHINLVRVSNRFVASSQKSLLGGVEESG